MKAWWERFWGQKNKEYRNFQLVFAFLGLHFVVPGLEYLLAPDLAVESFCWLNSLFGGRDCFLTERSLIWRVLAGTNTLTLGFLCVYLQLDIKRRWAALAPLVFMKGAAAASFFIVFLAVSGFPAFLVIALWDAANCALFVLFGRQGRAAAELDESVLVPRPIGWRG